MNSVLRDPVHRLVPDHIKPPRGPRRPRQRDRLWDFMLANAVGAENRMLAHRVAKAIGIGGNFKTQGARARTLALENIKIGRPICGATGTKKKKGQVAQVPGMWIPTTAEEIETCAQYIERMAAGTLNSAAALRQCRPFAR